MQRGTFLVPYSDEWRDELTNLQLKSKDVEEVEASSGMPVRHSLEYIANHLQDSTYLIIHKGKVEGLLGVHAISDDDDETMGVPYFLTTDKIDEFKYQIAKYGRTVVDDLLFKPYGFMYLSNFVQADYKETIHWLTRLGAVFSEEITMFNGVPFRQFIITRREKDV